MAADKKSDLKLTKDESDRFKKAFENEEFRKMFFDYAKEISDPENRKKYEEEIAMMEMERGVDVKFLHPKPGFVVKTAYKDTKKKVLINIAWSDAVAKATATSKKVSPDGSKRPGQQWSIPYSLAPIREDLDKAHNSCDVCDAVFHQEIYEKSQKDQRLKQLLIDTALDGIEREFKKKLDRKNLKFPKLAYKGVPSPTVIRNKSKEACIAILTNETPSPPDDQDSPIKFPNPYKAVDELKERQEQRKHQAKDNSKSKQDPTVPKYTIVQRSNFDLKDYRDSRDSAPSTRPNELSVSIELPLLDSATGLDLDVFETYITLQHKDPNYNLSAALPYPVDTDNGSAKFDTLKKCLIVTLPVLPSKETNNPITIQDSSESKPIKNEVNSPQYTYSQTDDEVVFVIHVQDIDSSTMKSKFLERQFSLEFSATEATNTTEREIKHFSLYTEFIDGCFNINSCNIDIKPYNLVVKLIKDSSYKYQWSKFMAGISPCELEEKFFITPENIEMLSQENENDNWANGSDYKVAAEVAEKTSEQLVVNIDVEKVKSSMTDSYEKDVTKSSVDHNGDQKSYKNEQEISNANKSEEEITLATSENLITSSSAVKATPKDDSISSIDDLKSIETSVDIRNNDATKTSPDTKVLISPIEDIPSLTSADDNEIVNKVLDNDDNSQNQQAKTNLDLSQAKTSIRITKDLSSKFKNNLIFELDD
ncbi:Protein kintoun [Trichoplax sp. H2]|nr:Protein kintoun [Trichoplax sp. H2]|eukprot:RDD43293.1 Protein kintoun [Trichoplax sp. H2]